MTRTERLKSFPEWRSMAQAKRIESKDWLEEIEIEHERVLRDIIPVDDFTFWFVKELLMTRDGGAIDRLKKNIKYYTFLLKPKSKKAAFSGADKETAKEIDMQLVCEMYGIQLNHYKAKCPFHAGGDERTPSFSVDRKTNRWKCFGACGEGGDTIDFVMKMDNSSFKDAILKLKSYL